ncbi:HAD family hydrolase [Ancylobacter terrae]|uniref:HAD family hydrolase n=1 Tax=Ancylobacter sp. sgz301288 TaxID=3342077 RepID=UPI003858DA98
MLLQSVTTRRRLAALAVTVLIALGTAFAPARATTGPLVSWNEGATKSAITSFVEKVTDRSGKDYVPIEDRIAVFDNDGTLWVEHPMYTKLAFTLDRVKLLAPDHPEWLDNPVLKAAIEDDLPALMAAGDKGLVELVAVTHAGMTPAAFEAIVTHWLATAEHPRFKRKYTDLVYQPMVELLDYLRANGFRTYIVSGGGIEFMRPWTNKAYGIPPAQVVGSSINTEFELVDGTPTLIRRPQISFIENGPGKPVGINLHIGQRPIAAFGNSDGDIQMLQWTTAGDGARLGALVHHTDAAREYAYDRATAFGRLDRGLDLAPSNGWLLIDMKNDWKTIFPSER